MGSCQRDQIVKVHGPLWEDGGERKEGSPMYLHVVGWKEKRNTDDESKSPNLIPVDFNSKVLQWRLTHEKDNHFILKRAAPVWYGLQIFDKERTPDRSHWGPIDGTPNKEEPLKTNFKFGSDTGGDTPDPDILIFLNWSIQEEESKLAALAQLIPSYISKPTIQPHLLAGAMAQIATTTTQTKTSSLNWK